MLAEVGASRRKAMFATYVATESCPSVSLSNEWQDIVALDPAIAAVQVYLQNFDSDFVQIVFGGSSEPAGAFSRLRLETGEGSPVAADNSWARGSGMLGVIILMPRFEGASAFRAPAEGWRFRDKAACELVVFAAGAWTAIA